MQLLFEEFFKKVYGLSEGKTSLSLKILVRILFYGLIAISLILIIYLIYTKKYITILIILGLAIIGESAHYIRKSREKVITNKVINEKSSAKELLKHKKSRNKTLLKTNKVKNKSLLEKSKTKVIKKKSLLKNKKVNMKKSSDKKIGSDKKINKIRIKKIKNKNLLKISKPKNKELLKTKVKNKGLLRK